MIKPLKIQLWSYNFDPEPSGIAPLSGMWARAMQGRGHSVEVIAAHPHYPKPIWGSPRMMYRENRDGLPTVRLPLWIGRKNGLARIRQEVSFAAALSFYAPMLGTPDVIVAVSPCFPAMAPAIVNAKARGIPWALWLQDILPDGAATTGLLESGIFLHAARAFERSAYASAARIFVISDAFERNLESKGVQAAKMVRIYNPSAVRVGDYHPPPVGIEPTRLLVMGNIGHSQGVAEVVEALQGTSVLEETGAELRIAGYGVAEPEVRASIRTDRIRMLGLLLGEDMEDEIARTSLGIVTQRSDVTEFNLPSKLMNYMAHSLPVLAIVNPASECARIVRESGAGWVVDSSRLDGIATALERILADRPGLERQARAAHAYAKEHFDPDRIAQRYEQELSGIV